MDFKHSDRYRKVGLNIAYYRKDRGFSQATLAEAAGASRGTISKVEIGMVGISLDMLFDIADALGLSPSKLLEFRD